MEILRSVTRNGNLLPAAFEAIERFPAECWTDGEHQVLPPKVSYARAVNAVVDAWANVFTYLDAFRLEMYAGQPPHSAGSLAAAYDRLLHALNHHIEACYSVMRCLGPKAAGGRPIWHRQAAKAHNLAGFSAFDDQVRLGYQNTRLGKIVNLLKHDGARLQILCMESEKALTPAYYIDGIQPSGSIGPAQDVHVDGNSAFSFSRDMLLHWWWLYRASELLAHVVDMARPTKMTVAQSLPNDRPASSAEAGPSEFFALCERIAGIQPDFLPDEVAQPFPKVTLSPARDLMRLRFPAGESAHRIVGEPRLTPVLAIDALPLSYRLPYAGDEDNQVTIHLS